MRSTADLEREQASLEKNSELTILDILRNGIKDWMVDVHFVRKNSVVVGRKLVSEMCASSLLGSPEICEVPWRFEKAPGG